MDDIDILTDSEKQACIDSVDFKFKVKEKLKAKLHDSVNAIKYNWLAGIPAFDCWYYSCYY